jgi:hypothetical protein
MKYRIVGADGKVYGPIGLDQIRQWLAEGRVDGRTPVYLEGASQWSYLGVLPELASGVAPARGPNGFATAGLVCGLLSWTCCFCCPCLPLNLLGLLLSAIALLQIGTQPQPQEGRAFAILGLVLSATNLLLVLAAILFQLAFGNHTVNWQGGQFQF